MKYSSKVAGQVIGRLREERGMTQEVLSGLAGIARSHLGMIECGRKSPNVETLWRIADALGLRLSRLIRLVEEAGESA
jgi:transcriptional regulator with XRE-family HTH domain